MRISDWSSDVCSSDLDYATDRLVHAAADTYELRANWKLAVENYLECYHLPWVHPGLNSYSPLAEHEYRVFADRFFGSITRSEEHTSELQSLMRISYAVFCL